MKSKRAKIKKKNSKTQIFLLIGIMMLGFVIGSLNTRKAEAFVFGSTQIIRNFLGLTDTPSAYNAGRVLFEGSSSLLDDGYFFWDNTNKMLGVGTSSPYAKLSVVGETVSEYFTATSTTATSTFSNLSSTQLSLGFTSGSIAFSNGSFLTQNNSNFFWDDAANQLKVALLDIKDGNITNVGDIALDTISDDAGVENTLSIANLNTAYDHSQDNTQAHLDYLTNNGDTGTGDYGFDGAVTINEAGADKDFRVEGVGTPNALFIDGTNGRIGVGTNAPTSLFHIFSPVDGYMTFEDAGNGVKYDMGSLGGYMRLKDSIGGTTFIRFAGTVSLDFNADTSIRFNTNKNDRDTIFYGDLAEIARFDAGTESLDFDDNQQVKFGTGGDSEIYYDGTDLIIDPDVVGTGKVLIGATGDDDLQAGNYFSGDGSQGITDTTSYWLCTAADCSTTCQANIKDGLITNCL